MHNKMGIIFSTFKVPQKTNDLYFRPAPPLVSHEHMVLTCKERIIDLINIQENSKDQKQRIVSTENIFQFLVQHKWFLDHDPKFRKVVSNKLQEFVRSGLWDKAKTYQEELFPPSYHSMDKKM